MNGCSLSAIRPMSVIGKRDVRGHVVPALLERGPSHAARYGCLCQTDTCDGLSPVNGDRFQSAHLLANSRPASRAIRSSSEGQTNRHGVRTSRTPDPLAKKWWETACCATRSS